MGDISYALKVASGKNCGGVPVSIRILPQGYLKPFVYFKTVTG